MEGARRSVVWLAQWNVEGNPEREAIFRQEKTLNDYKKHLQDFAKEKLIYFDVTEID